jgi:hypothetical protein
MSALRHFVYPHCGAWCVAYVVPGTRALQIVGAGLSYALAAGEAKRLNSV